MINHLFITKTEHRPPKEFVPTVVRVLETDDNGNNIIIARDLNSVINPLTGLSYTDFSIQKLIANGVHPKNLMIRTDLRLGFDSEIDKFNNYVKDNFKKIFVTPKSE